MKNNSRITCFCMLFMIVSTCWTALSQDKIMTAEEIKTELNALDIKIREISNKVLSSQEMCDLKLKMAALYASKEKLASNIPGVSELDKQIEAQRIKLMELVAKREAIVKEKKESLPELKKIEGEEKSLQKSFGALVNNKEVNELRDKQKALNVKLQEMQKNTASATVKPEKKDAEKQPNE